MARYIDADFVRSAKVPYDEELSEWERGWNDACDALAEDAPTADAVEIVRCKECKHYKASKVDPSRNMCWRKDVDGFHVCYDFYPTDYCSYGERGKDDAEIH